MILNKLISFLFNKHQTDKFLSNNFVMYRNEYISNQIILNGVFERKEILSLIQDVIPKTKSFFILIPFL